MSKELYFLQGRLEDYKALITKNPNNFYLCYDVDGDVELYLGDKILARGKNTEIVDRLHSAKSGYEKIVHSETEDYVTLTPNAYHVWSGEMSALTITLGSEINGFSSEYFFEFTSSSSGTNLVLPDSLKWICGISPTIYPNKTYQISILNNLAVIAEF